MPSIESSWSYIQRARARNFYDTIQSGGFDEAINNDLPGMPCNENDLERCMSYHKEHFMSELQGQFANEPEIMKEYTSLLETYMT
jgi:hypothetical protein